MSFATPVTTRRTYQISTSEHKNFVTQIEERLNEIGRESDPELKEKFRGQLQIFLNSLHSSGSAFKDYVYKALNRRTEGQAADENLQNIWQRYKVESQRLSRASVSVVPVPPKSAPLLIPGASTPYGVYPPQTGSFGTPQHYTSVSPPQSHNSAGYNTTPLSGRSYGRYVQSGSVGSGGRGFEDNGSGGRHYNAPTPAGYSAEHLFRYQSDSSGSHRQPASAPVARQGRPPLIPHGQAQLYQWNPPPAQRSPPTAPASASSFQFYYPPAYTQPGYSPGRGPYDGSGYAAPGSS
ncbi:hypothetical protein B0H17DRAFT_321532 [Mycena rosella]|uniref:Uncharacterized protein n=1 Tax=Mycena rosella TaxID=1033263 RepID=A0AAD7CSY0_MYCRO|nr:hypothetical protein B0H17DRAFT_321532 [Mycena rosella]